MSNNQYNSKKLAPFKKTRDALKDELKILVQEYQQEEQLNDIYFDEIGRAEKEFEQLIKQIEVFNRNNHSMKNEKQTDQNQGFDETIEKNVIDTLHLFLLNTSKKEYLEAIQETEIAKKSKQVGNLVMNSDQPNPLVKEQDDQEIQEMKNENGYYVTLRQGEAQFEVRIPLHIKTFKELKSIVKSCVMAEEKEVFYTDYLGNLLQPEMNVINELYPPIYELLRNYQPTIGIQIVKQKKIKDDTKFTDADFGLDGLNDLMTKQLRQTKRAKKQINWSQYLDYLTSFKYLLESFLFLSLLILYVLIEVDEIKFVTNSQLLTTLNQQFSIQKSYINPISNISELILFTIPDDYHITPIHPLKSALLVQTLVGIENFDNCHILNENQREIFLEKNQSCLKYDDILTDDLNNNFTQTQFNPQQYNPNFGGYVWEFNLSSKESFKESYDRLVEESWVQYNIKQSKFILNYYNSPSKRLIQVVITSLYLFNDNLLNYNSIKSEAFDLSEEPSAFIIYKNVIFYCAIILLISSFFDFFGLYLAGTKNHLIELYLSYNELLNKKKKMQAKKKEISEQDHRIMLQKELILSEYFIINLKVVFIVIRIPLIFDIIYIICQLGLVIKRTIDVQYGAALNLIDLQSSQFQDTTTLFGPLLLARIYSAVLLLFLMISIVRFLGNWSPYLKCYGLVMIRFNKESWFLLLVLIYIISICAMSWSITLQGKLINHDNFFFTFIGLLRCTLKYGLHNDIDQQGFFNNYVKEISYSFDTRYLQYIIIICISLIMVPIFISLMTQQVHNTKIEAKQKMLEMKKQVEE
ncbi:unnamed protein product (macronuclear) [Paramecium tetraurelia]|uniref:Transmembrane protein n=1 Tax=Paramecium tetraurelia TaxID=5888 RepID=A0EDB4_PARTE|nr:uncharacterized protein GSPATT00004150001 [Paramecium tetraurelia]CAK93281.1 unnamed protein product [Paramecium tetraurelia]|eukprot:XP_001460678.1 hypothetical protein (macronuclear) [Paramecium tetraurelia strain d4-2]